MVKKLTTWQMRILSSPHTTPMYIRVGSKTPPLYPNGYSTFLDSGKNWIRILVRRSLWSGYML